VTKCTFFKYGSSGTTESRDGLCILALNIINEKVRILLSLLFRRLLLPKGRGEGRLGSGSDFLEKVLLFQALN
jgi:hypothetical protein